MREAGLLENLGKQLFSSLIEASFQVEVETGAMASASFSSVWYYQRSLTGSVCSSLFVSVNCIFRLALKKALMQPFRVLRIQLWI